MSGLRRRPGCFTFADCRGRVTNHAGSIIYIPTAYMSSVFPCVLFVYIHCIQIAMLEYFFHILVICFVSKLEVCDVILVTLLASLMRTVSVKMADSGHFRPPLRLNVHEPNLADSFQKWKRECGSAVVSSR